MDFKLGMKISKWRKLFFRLVMGLVLIIFVGFINSAAQSVSDSINFTKKEIAFFKWGNGTNEVGMGGISEDAVREDIRRHKKYDRKTRKEIPSASDLKVGPVIPPTM